MSKSPYDCIEIKRTGQQHVRELTKGMSREQLLAFWNERTRRLQDRQDGAKRDDTRKKTA